MNIQKIHIHDFERIGGAHSGDLDGTRYACECGAIKEELYWNRAFVYWIQEADGTVIRGERR